MKGIGFYNPKALDMIEIKTCSDSLHAYKKHLHQELSIGYIHKGATMLNVNGKDHYIKAGEAVAIYPYVSHKCQPIDINNWTFTMIYIDNGYIKEYFDSSIENNLIGIKRISNDDGKNLEYIVDILNSNVSGFDKEVQITDTLNHILNTCDIDIKLETSKMINLIKTYIENHFLETLQLKDMEDKFGINRFSLIRNFKNIFNTTPNAYQLQLKVNYGKQLLKKSNNIVDIALRSGFYDQAHFTKEFKKAYGITPFQYYKFIH